MISLKSKNIPQFQIRRIRTYLTIAFNTKNYKKVWLK